MVVTVTYDRQSRSECGPKEDCTALGDMMTSAGVVGTSV